MLFLDPSLLSTSTSSLPSTIQPSSARPTCLPASQGYGIPLAFLSTFIASIPELSLAQIFITECYTQSIIHSAVPVIDHRFLIIEISRWIKLGKKSIWIRVDRLRWKPDGMMKFIGKGLETRANDHVQISATQDALRRVGNPSRENMQSFTSPPRLAHLNELLHIICQELTTYKLWPVRLSPMLSLSFV